MSWDVRPCSSADELRGAVAPIWYYFGRSVPIDEQFQRVERVLPPERMHGRKGTQSAAPGPSHSC